MKNVKGRPMPLRAASILLALCLGLSGLPLNWAQASAPPRTYVDRGACPFEGCTYRAWTVNARTAVHKTMDADSAVVFYLNQGEAITGLTGTVITKEVGVGKIVRPISEGPLASLKVGDAFYILNYIGEGYYLLWINGHIDREQIGGPSMTIIKEPITVWWVKVRNSKGQTGWTEEPAHFDGLDALG